MEFVIFGCCVVIGLGIYYAIVKPLLIPLTSRIPTGREYRASLGVKR